VKQKMAVRATVLSFLTGVALMLAACGSSTSSEEVAERMALACQTKFCACEQERVGILTRVERVPVLWRLNGDAYCPEGFVLKFDTSR